MRSAIIAIGLFGFSAAATAQMYEHYNPEYTQTYDQWAKEEAVRRKVRAANAKAQEAMERSAQAEESVEQLSMRLAAIEESRRKEDARAEEAKRRANEEVIRKAREAQAAAEAAAIANARARAAEKEADPTAPPTVAKRKLSDGRIMVIVDGVKHTVATDAEIDVLVAAAAAKRAQRFALKP